MVGYGDGKMWSHLKEKKSHRKWEGLPCRWANFMLDLQSGEILGFFDCDDPDEILRSGHYYYGLRTVMKDGKYKVVDFQPPSEATLIAKNNLYTVVGLYNKEYGF